MASSDYRVVLKAPYENRMKVSQESLKRIGIISAAFCAYAGFRYGILLHEFGTTPLTQVEQCTLTICLSLNMFQIVSLIWFLIKRKFNIAALIVVLILWQLFAVFNLASLMDRVLPVI